MHTNFKEVFGSCINKEVGIVKRKIKGGMRKNKSLISEWDFNSSMGNICQKEGGKDNKILVISFWMFSPLDELILAQSSYAHNYA